MKVLLYSNEYADASGFYRVVSPFSYIRNNYPKYEFTMQNNNLTWSDFRFYDMVFFHRPQTQKDREMIHTAKQEGCRIWVDYDDYLGDVPKSNPAFGRINPNLTDIMEAADVITFSTYRLKEMYFQYEDKSVVINNMLDQIWETKYHDCWKQRNDVITWRGSMTHEIDFAAESNNIQKLFDYKSDHTFTFMGHMPSIVEFLTPKKCDFVLPKKLNDYMNHFSSLRAKYNFVPLDNRPFNHSKSNIAWIESTLVGTGTIASSGFNEFKLPGTVTFEEFLHGMEPNVKDSMVHLLANYRAKKGAEIRLSILNGF